LGFETPGKMGTQADINVRPARRHAARGARQSGFLPLARLLLRTSLKLVFLFVVSSAAPACVLPVSPEFQAPPGAPNAAPEISNPNPLFGTSVASITGSQTFSFLVTDPNGGELFMRWVADAMPYNSQISRKISVTTNSVQLPSNDTAQPISETITCHDVFTLNGFSVHQIIAAVADKPFRDDVANDLLAVQEPGKKNIIPWTLTMPCLSAMSQ
jgi:hypothetical protein